MTTTKTPSALDVLKAAPARDDAWEQVGCAITLFEYEQKARDKRDAKIRDELRVVSRGIDQRQFRHEIMPAVYRALALLDGEKDGAR